MRTSTTWAGAVFLIFLFAALAASPTRAAPNLCVDENNAFKDDGACWNSLQPIEKSNVIFGIWTGASSRNLANELIGSSVSYYFNKDWLAIPEKTTSADLIEYFDLLYKTPANRKISWSWAYILAAMYVRDDDSDDRLSLLKFLREHDYVPTGGVFVGVKDANIVTIRSNEQDFDIALAGVAAQGLTKSQRERTIAFLRGLLESSILGRECNKTSPWVNIVYRHDIFSGENRLTAEVTIPQYHLICLGDRKVSLAEFFDQRTGFSPDLSLASYLVSRGLAYRDESIDPKWPKETIEMASTWMTSDHAETNGLYIFGDKTIPLIDEVIEYGRAVSDEKAPKQSDVAVESEPTDPSPPSSGTGFFVAAGIVATNHHVVTGCSAVTGTNAKGQTAQGDVFVADQANDLALIRFGDKLPAPEIARFREGKPVRAGEAITVVGFPLTGVLASGPAVTTGVVSNTAGIQSDIRMLQISAPIQPGNSGGPVLDASGLIAGMVVSKLDALAVASVTGDIPQNVNFAIKESVLRALLDAHGIEYQSHARANDVTDIAQRGQSMSVLVECKPH